MTIVKFLGLNLRAAEARLQRVTAPIAADPPGLWDALDHSVPGRVIGAVDRVLTRATPESRARQAWRLAALPWASLDSVRRMRAIGCVAMSAAVTHVALASTTSPVGGWWLIIPGMVMAFGFAAISLSWLGPASKRHE